MTLASPRVMKISVVLIRSLARAITGLFLQPGIAGLRPLPDW